MSILTSFRDGIAREGRAIGCVQEGRFVMVLGGRGFLLLGEVWKSPAKGPSSSRTWLVLTSFSA